MSLERVDDISVTEIETNINLRRLDTRCRSEFWRKICGQDDLKIYPAAHAFLGAWGNIESRQTPDIT